MRSGRSRARLDWLSMSISGLISTQHDLSADTFLHSLLHVLQRLHSMVKDLRRRAGQYLFIFKFGFYNGSRESIDVTV